MGGSSSSRPDPNYQRQQARELSRITDEENRRRLALSRGRMGKGSLLSGLDFEQRLTTAKTELGRTSSGGSSRTVARRAGSSSSGGASFNPGSNAGLS